MKRDELKNLIKESVREVLKEDNLIKTLFSESLKSYAEVLLDSEPREKRDSSAPKKDPIREALIFGRNITNNVRKPADKRIQEAVNKGKIDPLLSKMMDLVDISEDDEF